MAPTPEEHHPEAQQSQHCIHEPLLEVDDIVISGMSGTYPDARHIKDFSNILYNKKNPLSEPGSRWEFEHPELTQYVGKAPNVDTFDANFFTVNYRLANHMDPMSRKLFEHTYQAIYDAGLSPAHLSGKKVAVFIGSSYTDMEREGFIDRKSGCGLGLIGSNKSMFANRISYWLNTKGPSLSIDSADCSSSVALEKAYVALKEGECEAAVVGGAHLCLLPHLGVHHARVGALSQDGKVRSFSENSNGYILSDAVNILFLQKAKDALRNYAQILHVKNEYILRKDKSDIDSGYNRNLEITTKFIKDFYNEVSVSPQMVGYVEGYGIGIPNVDKSELETIEEVYCKDRSDTLLIGSVTSNIGLTEASAGIAGITKILLGYHTGEIAANLNCEQPRKDIAALRDGRMRIVTEHQPFDCTYAAVNTISVTGCNSHVLLCRHYKPKDLFRYASLIPYLIPLSARQNSGVQNIFDDLKSRPLDSEEIALLHNIHCKNISGHLGRGYIILDSDTAKKTLSITEKSEYFDGAKRPLWFVFSGMGSQWAGMGSQLMRIPIFASAIKRCHNTLAPKGLDLVHIITSPDETIFDNILHSFVGIAAVQIGLTDVLQTLGLVPDGIIGHSVGELGCAYADGCLSAEEMILAAYYRGLVSLNTTLIHGAMAAVGLGYQKICSMCPPEIDVACRNSAESCTISGPADVVKDFVTQLLAKGIFAKGVQTSNIAYHSRYISDAGPQLLKYLKDVIKNPKRRNKRWLSTSVPQANWNESYAQYCSAEYQTNNLLNPVLFEETCRLIPPNAVLIEVAPHGLLQAILKRSLSAGCRNIPLTKRGHEDNVIHLLRALGNIYMEGFSLDTQALYPKVEFPVSTKTPMLSHLVEWMHIEKWKIMSQNLANRRIATICHITKSIHDNDYKYLQGHIVKDKMCYPFAAAIVAVWDMFAMYSGLSKKNFPIIFKDVYFYAQPILFNRKPLRVSVSLFKGSFKFEVNSEYSKVASGFILPNIKPPKHHTFHKEVNTENSIEDLTSKDIYQLLSDRGYNYSGEFQSIEWANASLNEAALTWCNNWVTFLDGILQFNALRQSHPTILLPTFIGYLSIDVIEHANENLYRLNGKNVMQVISDDLEFTRSGGVFLKDLKYDKHLPEINQNLQKVVLRVTSQMIKNLEAISEHDVNNFMTLETKDIGKLDSLTWVENPCSEHKNIVSVKFAGLNHFDIRQATGIVIYDINRSYGMDYSGITTSGDRVMGIVSSGSSSSKVDPRFELFWPVPNHWNLEDAATVPFAYAYAFYTLVIKGHLISGMNVLIHEATDTLSQAAIRIALAKKCQVFATVGDMRKKEALRKLLPQLPEEHIFNCNDLSFSDNLLFATQGKGCDIILSCVKEELKNASLKCSASNGIVIDTSHIQDRENDEFGMFHLTKCRTYIIVDFPSIFSQDKKEDMKKLQNLVSDGIVAGYVVPLSRISYAAEEAKYAFRQLEKSHFPGRVLLRIDDNKPQVEHRTSCDAERCQIILWNDEVLGCLVAERLIKQGATKLCINCTTCTPYQLFKIRSWKKCGIQIEISHEKLTEDSIQSKLLNESHKLLGTIEGIYVILSTANSDETRDEFVPLLEKLDSMSRLLRYELKHFVVVSTVKALGYNVCLNRAKLGLRATWLDLSNICNSKPNLGYNNIGDKIEYAICSEHVTFIAEIDQVKRLALFEEIIACADIKLLQHIDSDTSLKELNLAELKFSLVHNILNLKYNIYLEKREVPLLTIKKIRELEEYLSDLTPVNNKGLSTFLKDNYSDELLATIEIVALSTLSHRVISMENCFDVTGQYLCIVPGIGGHYERFHLLCEQLKLPAVVLQPGVDHPYETVKDTAHRYAKILSKKTKLQDTFYILGYESGVMVALELAAILESQGMMGTVFCLGCAPSEFQKEVQHQLSEYISEEQLQDAVIRHIYTLMSGGEPEELNEKLSGVTTWTEKVDIYMRYLLGQMTHSAQFARALLEATLARLIQAQQNNVTVPKLRSKVVLLRSASTLEPPDNATLQQLSEQPVNVHQLQYPLSSVTTDMKCPALINQYLDNNILEKFYNKNICEAYFIRDN